MIGECIKKIREQNGLTQIELSKKLGLSRSAINAWEMGISVPSTQYVVELALLFNVSTDFLLGIKQEEEIDITYLKQEEKKIIYSLLNYFKKYKDSIDLLHENGLAPPDDMYEELYPADFKLPNQPNSNLSNIFKG